MNLVTHFKQNNVLETDIGDFTFASSVDQEATRTFSSSLETNRVLQSNSFPTEIKISCNASATSSSVQHKSPRT